MIKHGVTQLYVQAKHDTLNLRVSPLNSELTSKLWIKFNFKCEDVYGVMERMVMAAIT